MRAKLCFRQHRASSVIPRPFQRITEEDAAVFTNATELHRATRRDRVGITFAFAAAFSCAIAAHSLRRSTSARIDTLLVQPGVWLIPVVVLALVSRRQIADAVRSRGWSYFGFMTAAMQVAIAVGAGFAFGFGSSPWTTSAPFTLAGFLWRALAILIGQEIIRAVLARGLARREAVALVVPWLVLCAASIPWAGVDRLFDRDTALP